MGVPLTALVGELKASLGDAAERFSGEAADAAFERHVRRAALDFGRVRPVTQAGTLSLVAGQAQYPAPADFVRWKLALWGDAERRRPRPWERGWPGPFPAVEVLAGGAVLCLSPAPTALQISVLGADYGFLYFAGLAAGATAETSTVTEADRGLLVLRAQAEAMRELAMRESVRPVSMRDGFTGQARNGTPAGLAQAFLAEFERLAVQR